MVELYSGKLMPEQVVYTLSHGHHAFATRTIRRAGAVAPLPAAERQLCDLQIRSHGQDYDLYDYVSRNRVAGLLIQDRGRVVHERYELGIDADTHWLSMSMAKSISATLVGVALRDGCIGGVDDMLVRYLPELRGCAYDGVSVRQLLQMTSGARWDDGYTLPGSERRHMLDLQLAQMPGTIIHYMASLPRVATPGTAWNYSTGETHVVGALLRAATGSWPSDYLSERIWSRLGMQADAYWWLEAPDALEVAGSGICATLRDFARFGRFVLCGGRINDEQVLPEDWLAQASAPLWIDGRRTDYGYMWWPVPDAQGSLADGAFAARGIFGQFLYLNPRRQVQINVLSARSKPRLAEVVADNDFFNAVVRALG
ncbi:MAG: serine hydrolase [Pseudoxanthomonas sp.]